MQVVTDDFRDRIAFVAQNIVDESSGDRVFPPYVIREQGGVPVAIIGQAFPHTPQADGAQFTPGWAFGIDEARLQAVVDEVRSAKAQVVVLLSHNGMDIDLDLDVREGRVKEHRYRLLPVFSDLLPADPQMQHTIDRVRDPFADRLAEPIAQNEELLYRRGNFNGSWDQLIVAALMHVKDVEIARTTDRSAAGRTPPRLAPRRRAAVRRTWTRARRRHAALAAPLARA